MKEGYYILLQKIENFIKRYYRYKIIRGILLCLSLFFIIITLESAVEYYNHTSIFFRTTLFYLSLLFFLTIIAYYIVIPVLSLFRIGKRLNFKQVAEIISNHFEGVNDNLINTIELGKDIKKNHNETDLLIASIEQRTKLLNPIPFKIAISVRNLKKSFFYFLGSVFIILLIFSFTPDIFKDGTYRIIDHTNYYEPKAPFKFIVNSKLFFVKKGGDFTVDLLIEGDYIPNEVYISIGDNTFLMLKNQKNNNQFNFTIKNLNNSINIFFIADKYKSKKIRIEVLPAPILKNFVVEVVPPLYTGIEKSLFKNSGDLNIPYGSLIKWEFQTNFTDSVLLFFTSDSVSCIKKENIFQYSKQVFKSGIYSITMSNSHFVLADNITYQINIIPDIFPEINVISIKDSTKIGAYYYMLNVKDDYGFKKLVFNYRIKGLNSSEKSFNQTVIEINKGNRNQDIFFYFDFNTINIQSEYEYIEYFFEIFDNDYISGYKSTKSSLIIYKPHSRKETRNEINEHENNTKKIIDESKKLVDDIQKEISEFKRKEINNEISDWDRKNFLKNISKKQKELNSLLEKIKNENKKRNNLNNQLYKYNQEILRKQKEIQEILNQLMDEELKELLRELEKLRNEFDQKEFEKIKDKLDLSYKDLNENLDKSLELLKRFQVEEKIQNLSEDLDRLSKRQEKLSNENYKKKNLEEQKVNQNSIKNNFNSLKKEFEETIQKNQELKRPFKLEKFDQDFDDIEKKLENIEKEIEKKSDKKINKQRKEVSKSMKKLSKKMNSMLQQMNSQSLNMNLQDLRQIIENLNKFSFTQEDVYNKLRKTYSIDPKFVELIKQQNKLNSDFELLKDSLNALAGRIPHMNRLISKEVKDLVYNLGKTIYEFEARHRRAAIRYQRNVINSSNILALYLEELSEQIQMSQSSSGNGQKNMPNNAIQKLKKQQENLKQQLEQLLEELKRNGGKKSGNQINKNVVKSLAEQEIFNKMLNDLQNSKGLTPETMQKLKEIERLSEKNIEDLINKNITPDLLKRNENIKTRLLEAEKSEREREKEKIRESNEGKNVERKFPKEIEDFLKRNNKYKETLQKNNLNLKKYYQNLSKEYYQRIK